MKVNGIKIRKLREDRNKTIACIAKSADLSTRRIQQIEQGNRANINLNIARAIARSLGVKLEDISTGVGQ